MAQLQTYVCQNCNEEFVAHPSAKAAERELCSPACELAHLG